MFVIPEFICSLAIATIEQLIAHENIPSYLEQISVTFLSNIIHIDQSCDTDSSEVLTTAWWYRGLYPGLKNEDIFYEYF